jgi:hypothetical protein
VFPVRYRLNSYILFGRDSIFKGLDHSNIRQRQQISMLIIMQFPSYSPFQNTLVSACQTRFHTHIQIQGGAVQVPVCGLCDDTVWTAEE